MSALPYIRDFPRAEKIEGATTEQLLDLAHVAHDFLMWAAEMADEQTREALSRSQNFRWLDEHDLFA